MKKSVRFLPGLVIGAVAGALPALLYVFRLRHTCRDDFNFFDEIIEIIFGRFFDKHYVLLIIGLGAIIGAAIGVSLAISKRCFAMTALFICGIVIGASAFLFPANNLFNQNETIWEQIQANERASTYLQFLKVIERGKTNEFYFARFQNRGQMILTNYLRQTEEQMERFNGNGFMLDKKLFFTNSAAYRQVKKYLATHTNNPSGGGDF